jgi:hypothetical protein
LDEGNGMSESMTFSFASDGEMSGHMLDMRNIATSDGLEGKAALARKLPTMKDPG